MDVHCGSGCQPSEPASHVEDLVSESTGLLRDYGVAKACRETRFWDVAGLRFTHCPHIHTSGPCARHSGQLLPPCTVPPNSAEDAQGHTQFKGEVPVFSTEHLSQRRVHSKLRDNDLVTDILSLFFSRLQVGGSFFLDDACSV